jgi:hypothetical protein
MSPPLSKRSESRGNIRNITRMYDARVTILIKNAEFIQETVIKVCELVST